MALLMFFANQHIRIRPLIQTFLDSCKEGEICSNYHITESASYTVQSWAVYTTMSKTGLKQTWVCITLFQFKLNRLQNFPKSSLPFESCQTANSEHYKNRPGFVGLKKSGFETLLSWKTNKWISIVNLYFLAIHGMNL